MILLVETSTIRQDGRTSFCEATLDYDVSTSSHHILFSLRLLGWLVSTLSFVRRTFADFEVSTELVSHGKTS
jgi:hypothetical protein